MGYVRVRPGQVAVVRHPEGGHLDVPNPALAYRDDDPLVKAYPWMFATDEELETEGGPIPIEMATAAPGERRMVRRPRAGA